MNITIPYGGEIFSLDIADTHKITVLKPKDVYCSAGIEKLLSESLDHPSDSPALASFISDSDSVLVIVNDATRPTPTGKIIEHILKYLDAGKTSYLVATGTHNPPTEEELIQIFGGTLNHIRKKIIIHNSKDEDNLVYLGKTSFGTEVFVNKAIKDYDKIITINSVEPHYFAGYTGGRKSFCPGIAGYKTIESNHRLALSEHSKTLRLEGNPVHEDMTESASLLSSDIFSIQVVLDRSHKAFSIISGNLFSSFLQAVKKAEEVFLNAIDEKADIVIPVATYPSDIDLYQSQRCIDNASLALKENGILILVSECRKKTGPDSFIKLMASSNSTEEILKKITKGYKLGYHKAAKLIEIMNRASIWAVTGVEEEIIRSIFMKPFKTINDALKSAIEIKGEKASICILLDGSLTVPYITNIS